MRDGQGALSSLPRAALQASAQRDGNANLGSLPLRQCPVLYRDHALEMALRRVHDHEILPVVHRADHRTLEGVISLDEILETYRMMGGSEASRDEGGERSSRKS
ncbi:MAG TPA: hypothetical protein VK473_10030 [Terriglobales bacterium]|nr:hypothetical protein [Terriglobales bacterium]